MYIIKKRDTFEVYHVKLYLGFYDTGGYPLRKCYGKYFGGGKRHSGFGKGSGLTLCDHVMALWTGIMEIANESGLIRAATNRIIPIIRGLFPELPKEHKAWNYISLNIIANILGLGWAATPAGLKAMEELQSLNRSDVASDAMCTFLIINISSLQLIPVNIIAYRSQYGSVNPAAIVAPAILATLVSTLAAVFYCSIKINKKSKIH